MDKVADLPRLVGNTKPGTKASITVFRRGAMRDLSITIAEIEPDEKVAAKSADAEGKAKPSTAAQQLGLVVAELTPAQAKELKIKGGVRVVSADDAAARAGLRADDVIVALANTEVRSLKDFEAALARAEARVGLIPQSAVAPISAACQAGHYDFAALGEAIAVADDEIRLVVRIRVRELKRQLGALKLFRRFGHRASRQR